MGATLHNSAAVQPIPPSILSENASTESSFTCTTDSPLPSKKKKKKKSKKASKQSEPPQAHNSDGKPPVLSISRNKHWKYISSYHVSLCLPSACSVHSTWYILQGPWLQLPIELLDSLSILNEDPTSFNSSDSRSHLSLSANTSLPQREALSSDPAQIYHKDTRIFTPITNALQIAVKPGRTLPPPIDPGIFRSVVGVRRLIDEAAELSVRASSGLSQAELTAMRNPALHTSWGLSQALGIGVPNASHGGRNVAMSAMRIHRLRALAVQKLAQAYRMDEVASSVMVMQGGTVFDDLAQRVLKVGWLSIVSKVCQSTDLPVSKIPAMWTPNISTSSTKKYLLGN